MYADTHEYQWIVSRFEKKQGSGNYIVRDDESETTEYERYVVPSTNVIPFPMPNEKYEPGEQILALWYDENSQMWSTMFYQATVVEVKPDHQLVIKYKSSQGTPNIIIDDSKVSKYPEGFNLQSIEESEQSDDEKGKHSQGPSSEHSTKTEKQAGDNSGKESKEESKPKIPPQEEARIRFMADQKPSQKEKPDFKPLTDEDFNALAGPRAKPNRMHTVKGTPLLDFLEDEQLFPKSAPHITGSGILRRKNIPEAPEHPSALMNGPVQCGRINKVLHEWR